MREVAFIKQNKQKWLNFERILFEKNEKVPDELADLFLHLMNDLAYAKTYYPKSKIVTYLNDLSARAFHIIYSSRKNGIKAFFDYFKYGLPMLLYRNRNYMIAAFIIFLFFVFVGVFSSIKNTDYPAQVLGSHYINMTLENIKNGNPLGVYQSENPHEMFFEIGLNNLMITLKVYISSLLFCIGTIYYAYNNGVMVGAFQTFFYNQHLLFKSAVGIWMHGSFEIFSIVIALMSGLMLGTSYMFPKTYSRKVAFLRAAKDSVLVYLSTIPFIIFAAFIESYVTRYTNITHVSIQLLISLGTLIFIFWYYVIYPRRINKKYMNGMLNFLKNENEFYEI